MVTRFAAGRESAMIRRLLGNVLLCLGGVVGLGSAAHAQFPQTPITVVVPFAAGGPTDKVARDLADALRKTLGIGAVLVENVVGAGGTLGAAKVAKAAPDGYNVLLHHVGMATAPALFRKLPFNTLADFEFLGMINEVPMTLIGRPGLPASNLTELRQWVHDNQGRINLATAGLGAASHLCGLLIQQRFGVTMNTVSYKGTAPAMADLLAGQVDLMCDQTTHTSGQIEPGRIRAYAVTSLQRLNTPALAKLPTLHESGMAGLQVTIWHGLYAPKGTPAAVVNKLNLALRAAVQDPTFVQQQQALGATLISDARLTPAGHKKFVESEITRWGQTMRATGQFVD